MYIKKLHVTESEVTDLCRLVVANSYLLLTTCTSKTVAFNDYNIKGCVCSTHLLVATNWLIWLKFSSYILDEYRLTDTAVKRFQFLLSSATAL